MNVECFGSKSDHRLPSATPKGVDPLLPPRRKADVPKTGHKCGKVMVDPTDGWS